MFHTFRRVIAPALAALLVIVASTAHAADWGSLKGRFLFDGDAPAPAPINADKDPQVCGKMNLVNESLVVSPDKGLANVVVWVRSKVKPHPDYAATDDAKIELNNIGCHFVPHVVAMRVGQTLVVKNSDPVGHNTKVDGTSTQFNQTIPANGSSDQSIDGPESLPAPVSCGIHPWMSAKLVVRPNPYFAVTDKDGRFEIKNLPAGELEFQIWHELPGFVTKGNIGGSDATWEKGRVKWTIEPGKTTDLGDIKLAADQFKKE